MRCSVLIPLLLLVTVYCATPFCVWAGVVDDLPELPFQDQFFVPRFVHTPELEERFPFENVYPWMVLKPIGPACVCTSYRFKNGALVGPWTIGVSWGRGHEDGYGAGGGAQADSPWVYRGVVYRPVEFREDGVLMRRSEPETAAGLGGTKDAMVLFASRGRSWREDEVKMRGERDSWSTQGCEIETSFRRLTTGPTQALLFPGTGQVIVKPGPSQAVTVKNRQKMVLGDILTIPANIDDQGKIIFPERKFRLERVVRIEQPTWPVGWAVFEPLKPATTGQPTTPPDKSPMK